MQIIAATLPNICEAAALARAYSIRAQDVRDMVSHGQLPGLPVGPKVLVAPHVADEALLRLVSGESSGSRKGVRIEWYELKDCGHNPLKPARQCCHKKWRLISQLLA